MAYVAPTVVTAGDAVTAASYNVLTNDVIDLRSYQNRYVRTYYTSGNITLNSTSAAAVKSGGELDLTLGATVGDVITFTIDAYIDNNATGLFLDFATLVSGSAQSFFGSGLTSPLGGLASLTCPASTEMYKCTTAFKTLVSGDISAGNVTVRPFYRTIAASNRTMIASSNQPLIVYMRNLGPVTT